MSGQEQGSLIMKAGLSEVYDTGTYPNFSLKYFIPVYDPRTDLEIHDLPYTTSTSAIPNSASVYNVDTATSATVFNNIDGEILWNFTSGLNYAYRLDYTGNIITDVLSSPSGTLTANTNMNSKSATVNYVYDTSTSAIVGRPAVGTPYTSAMLHYSGDNINYTGDGNFNSTSNFVEIPSVVNVPLYWDKTQMYDTVSYISNEGDPNNYGTYQVRLPASIGSFKFNKIILFGQKVDTNGDDVATDPFPFAVVCLSETQTKLSSDDPNNSNNVSEFIADISIAFSRNTSGTNEITYNPEEYWTRIKTSSDGTSALEYQGSVLVAPIDGGVNEDSPKAKLHIIEPDTNEPILRISRWQSSNRKDGFISMNPVTSAMQFYTDDFNGNRGYEFGDGASAIGSYSFAIGNNPIANNEGCIAQGSSVIAGDPQDPSALYAQAYGVSTSALGKYSRAHGYNVTVNGNHSTVTGRFLNIQGAYKSIIGDNSNIPFNGTTPSIGALIDIPQLNPTNSIFNLYGGTNWDGIQQVQESMVVFADYGNSTQNAVGFYGSIGTITNPVTGGYTQYKNSIFSLLEPSVTTNEVTSSSIIVGNSNTFNGYLDKSIFVGDSWTNIGNTESSLIIGKAPVQFDPNFTQGSFGTSGCLIVTQQNPPTLMFNWGYDSCFVIGNGHIVGGGLQAAIDPIRSYMFVGGFGNMVAGDYSFNYGEGNRINSAYHQINDTINYVHNYTLGYNNWHEGIGDDSDYLRQRNNYTFGARIYLEDTENLVVLGGSYTGSISETDNAANIRKVKHGLVAGRNNSVFRVSDVISLGNTNTIDTSAVGDTVTLNSADLYQIGQSNIMLASRQSDGAPSPTYTVPDSSIISCHQFGTQNTLTNSYEFGTFANTKPNNISFITTIGQDNTLTFKREDLYTTVFTSQSVLVGNSNTVTMEGVYSYQRNSIIGSSNLFTANSAADWADSTRISMLDISLVGSKNTIGYVGNNGQLDTAHNNYRITDGCTFLGSNGTSLLETLNRAFKSIEDSDTLVRAGNASTVLMNGYNSVGSAVGGVGIALGAARIDVNTGITTNIRQMIVLPVNPIYDNLSGLPQNPLNGTTTFAIPTHVDIKAMIDDPNVGKPPVGTLYHFSRESDADPTVERDGLLKVYMGEDSSQIQFPTS